MFRQIQRTRVVFQTLALFVVGLSLLMGFFPNSAYAKSRLEQSATGCAPVHFIGIRGSGEDQDKKSQAADQNMGGVVYPVYQKFSRQMHDKKGTNVSAEGLQYDAVSLVDMLTVSGNLTRSLEGGTALLTRSLQRQKSSCPDQMIVLVGYSQGALVIHQALDHLYPDLKRNIKAVLVFGDPLFDPKSKQSYILGNYNPKFHKLAGGIMAKKDFPGWVYGIRSYCKVYDPICDANAGGVATCAVKPLKLLCHHFDYYEDKPLHEQAASYLASLFPSQSLPDSPKLVTCSDHMTAPWVALYGGINYGGQSLCFEGKGQINLRDYSSDMPAGSVNIAAYVTFFDSDGNHISYGYGYETADLGDWKWRFVSFVIES